MEGEVWYPCVGYEGEYEVSNLGRIKSLARTIKVVKGERKLKERIMKQQVDYSYYGDYPTGLRIELNYRMYQVSRLVYMSVYPNKKFKDEEIVIHMNKNPLDNRVSNLFKGDRYLSKLIDVKASERTKVALSKIKLGKMRVARIAMFNSRTEKTCSSCGHTDKIERFKDGRSQCDTCIGIADKLRNKKRAQKNKKRYENIG